MPNFSGKHFFFFFGCKKQWDEDFFNKGGGGGKVSGWLVEWERVDDLVNGCQKRAFKLPSHYLH